MPAPQSEERRLIERDGQALGLIVGKPNGYVIYACTHHIWPLDRRIFRSWDEAEGEIALCDQALAT